MATSRYGRPGTYPEKSIGLGNLEHKYSKYFRQNERRNCTECVRNKFKMATFMDVQRFVLYLCKFRAGHC